jgi:hypothetical protein
MSANDEMRTYLELLADHERNCARQNCPFCLSAERVYELVRNLIFSGVIYPEVEIQRRRDFARAATPPGATREASAKKAA